MKQSTYERKAALYERIYIELSTIIDARICEYNGLRESMKVEKFFKEKHYVTSDEIDFNGSDITWEWDDYWMNAGHKHGNESIPASWIYDKDWKVKVRKEFQDKLNDNKKKKAKAKREVLADERKQYENLKRKYGD